MLSVLRKVVWFEVPKPRTRLDPVPNASHLARWQRWCDAAQRDSVNALRGERLSRSVFGGLRRDIMLGLVAIAVNAGCAFGAAITLKSLIQHLVTGDSALTTNLTLGITCIVLTYLAWLALNHTFMQADVVGIGARTYIEQRLLHKKRSIAPSDQPADLVTLLDREAARVENAWSGLIFIILALATITFTSAYFFVALGLSALAALSVILVSSAVIYWNAKQLNAAHAALTVTAADRIEVGLFSLNNRLLAWLKNWNDELFRRYADKRDGEERALLKAARLIARINLISTLTPIVAMLAAVFTQLAHVGYVDPAGLLSTMALVGGLKSVANNIPFIVQSLSQGIVGHTNVAKYLSSPHSLDTDTTATRLPATTAKHIAVVGAAGSGKTSVLKIGARHSSQVNSKTFFVPDEPWIFPGGLYENLCLYRSEFTDDEARRALTLSRLPGTFYGDYLSSKSRDRNEGWNVSRGQGKRLELARAILAEPKFVYLDQPTAGLDDDLANGLLASLLRGPWHDTTVIYATDKPDEKDAADEIWVVAGGEVVEVMRNLTPRAANPARERKRYLAQEDRSVAGSSQGVDRAEFSTSSRRSLMSLGVAKVAVVACVLFACRDVLTIVGDYTAASGISTTNARTAATTLIAALSAGALLSIFTSLFIVKRSIVAASRNCRNYFSTVMSPKPSRPAFDEVDQDYQSKLTWDQRRIDELLPEVLLNTLGAVTLLLTTAAFVLSKNIFVLLPLVGMCFAYWHSSKRSGRRLQDFNDREIGTTSTVLERVEAITWSSARFDLARDNSALVNWLNKSLMNRAFASMDNAGARRWFNYKLDLMGVLFLSVVVGSTVFVQAGGGPGLSGVLALSLSYSLIAVFARVGRCLVDLRQVLDSADRLLTPPTCPAPCWTGSAVEDAALVSFSEVTYVAPHTGAVLLEELSESFASRDVVVVMGPSGVGKSTFAKLVVGRLQPTTGVLSTLGRTTGYVSNSHAEDILLLTSSPIFKPGRLIEHFNSPLPLELARVVDYLDVADVVGRLPSGFDEPVPATGQLNLSKTELQRLALLDLLINRPAVAILDEATSELSTTAEISILQAVISALPDTLFFIITHNPGLTELANRVFHFNGERRLLENSGQSHTTADRNWNGKEEDHGMAAPTRCVL
ncbi:ATP-binding cassette domain-containing protein [Rhodococcus opacus]|uniref:ATP-binding cassette domain-containing protein n=1 Tax=Rhodococcus opacus TaxID=37919 RepID=UPI00247D7DB4|nr:ABC-type transport system involved in cytochrome bd biosynthesis fused ATPase/permease subunit [Rhodococcus opacus]